VGIISVFLALASAAFSQTGWIPARWHSHTAATLEAIKSSPVNCILIEPADWDPAFLGAASKAGVSALGVIRPGGDASALVQRATALKLSGVVFEGDFEPAPLDAARALATQGGLIVVELPSRARIRLDSGDPIAGTGQALWPGLEIEHNGKSVAGPTSAPWINTNGGFLRFLRARTGASVWIAADPPPGYIFPVERYLQAIGDAAIPGARWIVSLDADFEARLHRRDAAALKDWRRIGQYLRFYEQWRPSSSVGAFGVVMDRDTGGLLSGFLLDMLAAQRTSTRIIPPGRVNASSLEAVKVLLDLDAPALTGEERKAIRDFVARGGTVLDPPPAVRFPEPQPAQMVPAGRDLDRLEGLWEMVYNATLRKNFGVRAFNTAGILSGAATPDGGRTVIVHLLNFMDFPGESISVHALGAWKRATLYQPEGATRELTVYPVQEGTAVDIDGFATAVAIRFE
jgi:hypothetical protein